MKKLKGNDAQVGRTCAVGQSSKCVISCNTWPSRLSQNCARGGVDVESGRSWVQLKRDVADGHIQTRIRTAGRRDVGWVDSIRVSDGPLRPVWQRAAKRWLRRWAVVLNHKLHGDESQNLTVVTGVCLAAVAREVIVKLNAVYFDAVVLTRSIVGTVGVDGDIGSQKHDRKRRQRNRLHTSRSGKQGSIAVELSLRLTQNEASRSVNEESWGVWGKLIRDHIGAS